MVGAQQERVAAGVRVGVGDFSGAATPATNRDTHFKCLHTHTHTQTAVVEGEGLSAVLGSAILSLFLTLPIKRLEMYS